MKIAIFTKSTLAHGIGGMGTNLEDICRELVNRGHTVQVVTTRHPAGISLEKRPGLWIRYLDKAPPGRYSRAWWRESRKAFEEIMDEEPPDLVLSQSLAASSVVRVPLRPAVFPFLYGRVLSHVKSEWHEGYGVRHTLRYLGIRLPEMVYYALVHERPLLRRADAVLATYDQLVPALRNRCRQVFVSYNGVDVDRFAPDQEHRNQVRKRLGIGENEIVVLLAGVMTRQKGMHLGLEALGRIAARFPALRLMVVGGGPEEGSLRSLAARSPLSSRIDLVGDVPHHEMPGYFNAADIFIHPSLRVEGLPTVIVEAMASGLPVVATDMGGTSTAVIDRLTGILVPNGNIERLTAAVEALVTDRSLAVRLAAAGLQLARERFAWPEIVDRLLADLAKVETRR